MSYINYENLDKNNSVRNNNLRNNNNKLSRNNKFENNTREFSASYMDYNSNNFNMDFQGKGKTKIQKFLNEEYPTQKINQRYTNELITFF